MRNLQENLSDEWAQPSDLVPGTTGQWFEVNGHRMYVVTAGPQNGSPLIFLHGFPEFWYGWRHQIQFFANRGYHVIVSDQRGYNLSGKPEGLKAYHVNRLVEDVTALLDIYGYAKATIIGHDWGALVAWWTAIRFPYRVHRLVILNVPHPSVASRFLRRNIGQMFRSLYILFFQLPWVPEKVLSARGFRAMGQAMQKSSRPGTFSERDIEQYVKAWSMPGALTSMLNWYRALRLIDRTRLPKGRIQIPTLILWGAHDTALRRDMAAPSAAMCFDSHLVYFENASHWLHHEEPERVNRLIEEFVK